MQLNIAIKEIRELTKDKSRIVFVSGNFNIVHPGHLRLFNFAASCGDFLVVGVNPDKNGSLFLSEEMRLEAVKSIGVVDYALILDDKPDEFIRKLQPDVVVKGKEFENKKNKELEVVNSYGGKLLFTSGDIRFSSLDLIQKKLSETAYSNITKPNDYPKRHVFSMKDLMQIVYDFSKINTVVVGDLIMDEYIICEPLGMSQEDPTIVVAPLKNDLFIGGAAIVAGHAAGMGANVSYFSVVGDDSMAQQAKTILDGYHIKHTLITDGTRPTTLKQRYRANDKTLLRVSNLKQHNISKPIADSLYKAIIEELKSADLLMFSDFSYGCLPQDLVDKLIKFCKKNSIAIVGDSQASSQVGDVSRFKSCMLLTPTEREARLALRDFSSGLVVVAEKLQEKTKAHHIVITMGAEGALIHGGADSNGDYKTDQLGPFNSSPVDVAGAGDAFLTCSSLALATGADIWKSAYLGSVASACQIGRLGNRPLQAKEILTELSL